MIPSSYTFIFFFFNDTATTEIYTLSLHDALPICATSSCGYREPSLLQASAKTHTGPVQKHPAVGRRDRKLLTNLVRLDPHHLAHHEDPRRVLGKAFQAALERLEEPALGKRRFGIAPFGRHAGVVAIFPVQIIEILQGRLLVRQIEGPLAARAADEVDDLVLEDPHQPGAHGGLSGKILCAPDRRYQRLLNGVLGLRLVPQLQHREPQQHRPMLLEVQGSLFQSIRAAPPGRCIRSARRPWWRPASGSRSASRESRGCRPGDRKSTRLNQSQS